MRKIGLLAAILIVASLFQNVSAQTFLEKMAKKAAKKAEQVAEKKTEEKVEEETEKQLEKILDEQEKTGEEEKSADYEKGLSDWAGRMARMGYSGAPVPIEDVYTFVSSMAMNIKAYDGDGNLSNDGIMKIYTNPGDETFAYEFVSGNIDGGNDMQKGIIIMDIKNQATIILNNEDGKKTGFVYGAKGLMDGELYEDVESDEEDVPEDVGYVDPRITKTGRTRTILGYKCEEYKFKDEESEGLAWITKDMKWKSDDFMSSIFRTSMYSHGVFGGFLMASESVDLGNGEKSTYEVTEINKNDKSSFSIADYQVTNLGSFKMPDEEKTE